MGLFGNIFKSIGSGLSSVVHTVGSGLKSIKKEVLDPVYKSVIKPVYKSVIKPVYKSVVKPAGKLVSRVGGKILSTGEHMVDNGLDFSEKFTKGNQDLALGAQKGVGGLIDVLSNPLVMIGGGILALVLVTKI
jgi:hypothetical protein